MGGRIYDPLAGRFTTADPIMQAPYSSQGQNRYAYVFNDPINATDPSGFSAVDGRDVYDTSAASFTVAYIPAVGILAGTGVSAWGAAGGTTGGVANVVGTLLANPFGSSAGGTYGAPAPSGAPSSNPVKPGGMNAFGQGRPPGPGLDSARQLQSSPLMGGRPAPFVPGPYVNGARLSDEAMKLLKPIFDRYGYDLGRIRIHFTSIRGAAGETDANLIHLDRSSWQRKTPLERMQLLTHEITHAVQFDRFGYWQTRLRLASERLDKGEEGVYDVPRKLDRMTLEQIDPIDYRFTLESIATRMESFMYKVTP